MRIVIGGAGIAGLALAGQLADSGAEVVLLERAAGPREQGYMIDFFGPGYDVAERMGLLPRLRELGYDVDEVGYVDERGRKRARISYAGFARTVRGRLLSLMRPDLEAALREHSRVRVRYGNGIAGVETGDGGASVTLTDGSTMDCDVLVGADGIHSTVRELVFGPQQRFLRYLGMHTAAWTYTDPEAHARLGRSFWLTDTMRRQLGCYALRDGRVAVFAVHRNPEPELPEDPQAAVRQVYGGLGWITGRALEACPREFYYDQVAQLVAPQWTNGRAVLLGDSCQAVSLLAGQGASLAMGAARVLARELTAAARDGEIDAAFARYERAWQPVVQEKQRIGRDAAKWFLPDTATRLRMRRVAVRLTGLPGVDRIVASAMAGKSVPAP